VKKRLLWLFCRLRSVSCYSCFYCFWREIGSAHLCVRPVGTALGP
jgi:hypothetical protein